MEWLATLGRTMGFSLAAGVNLYATVALLGLASRYGWVALPEQFKIFDNSWIIGAAGVLYAVEFVADKIPWVDSIWDSVHTFIRPVGGAVIAVATLGDQSPAMQGRNRAAWRHGRRRESRHQGQHARGGEREPGAIQQLDPQLPRRRLRDRHHDVDVAVSARRVGSERDDPGFDRLDHPIDLEMVARATPKPEPAATA